MEDRGEIVGGEQEYFPTHSRKFPHTYITREMIEKKREQLRERRELWDLERELEDEVLEFREIQEAWLADLVTLDDVLEQLMSSGLCNTLSAWRKRRQKTHTRTHR